MKTSHLENHFALQLKAYGLPTPIREFVFHPLRRWRFDFAYPAQRVAFEVEGALWAGGRHTRAVHKDIEKYTAAAMMGWFVYRVTPEAIRDGRGARWASRFLEGWRTSGKDETVPLPIRFWMKAEIKNPNECWPWIGRKDRNGYGEFQMNGQKRRAPRIALWLAGSDDSGNLIMHSCDNPSCVNPAHLSPGTAILNNLDRDLKGRTSHQKGRPRNDKGKYI